MGLEKVCCLHLFLSPRFVRSLMTHVAVRPWGNFPSLVLEIDECLFVTHERLLNEAFNCQFNAKPKQPTVSSGCWWPSVWFLGCSQSNLAVLSLWLDFRESPWRKQTSPDDHFHSHQKQQTNKHPCQPLRTCLVSSFISPPCYSLSEPTGSVKREDPFENNSLSQRVYPINAFKKMSVPWNASNKKTKQAVMCMCCKYLFYIKRYALILSVVSLTPQIKRMKK